jgi:hypothetical protein
MSGPSHPGSNAAEGKSPRMVRARTAIVATVVSLLIGVGIGAASGTGVLGPRPLARAMSQPPAARRPRPPRPRHPLNPR